MGSRGIRFSSGINPLPAVVHVMQANRKIIGSVVGWATAAIILPFLLLSGFMFVNWRLIDGGPSGDYVCLALALLTGVGCLLCLPVRLALRVLLSVIYLPLTTPVLYWYGVAFGYSISRWS
jgi:hypothetical protein